MNRSHQRIRSILVGFSILALGTLNASDSDEAAATERVTDTASMKLAIQAREMEKIGRIRADLDEESVDTFRALVEGLPHSPYREKLLYIVVVELARYDGEFAVNYALSLATENRQEYASAAMLAWVSNSPDEAWEFFLTLSNFGQDRAFKAEMLVYGTAETDIDKAFQFYNQLSDEIDCIDCSAKTIMRKLFYEDETSKIDEFETRIEDEFEREQWQKNKWDMWGYYQPSEALERLNQIATDEERNDARVNVYGGWARYQPKECIEHLVAHESEDVFAAAFPKIIHEWGSHSLIDRSLDLIKSIDRDSITDRSIVAISSRLAAIDPEFSWELVDSIDDQIIRESGIRHFVWSTSKSDPQFLRDLIERTTDPKGQNAILWWFLQYVPWNGHFDLEADMQYFQLINNYNNENKSLEHLASEVLDPSSSVSKHITPARLWAAIEAQTWLSTADKKRFNLLLNPQ